MDRQEDVNKRYPREIELQDKSKVSLRPLVASDEESLLEFFKRKSFFFQNQLFHFATSVTP